MKSFYLLLLVLAVSAVSCRTKEGEPGPAGQPSLKQQGSVSGTITYTDTYGNPATTTFNYQYYESLSDNKFNNDQNGADSYYELEFSRRDLKDYSNDFSINAYGNGLNGVEESSHAYMNFGFNTIINNTLYQFSNNDNIDMTNVNLDPSTGRLTSDFSGLAYYNGNEATITGKIDVILNRGNASPK